jgi:hypothetical protein
MKKIMTLMLGLSFLMGTVSLFAQDTSKTSDTSKKKAKAKKAKKAAKTADTDKK